MIQSIKAHAVSLLWQPGRVLKISGFALIFAGMLLMEPTLLLLAALVLLPSEVWLATQAKPFGENFSVLPSMPLLDGKAYRFLYQRKRKDAYALSCRDFQRLLVADTHTFGSLLTRGRYCTITHESVLHALQKCEKVQFDREPRPVYRKSLRLNLIYQTGGRCKHCSKRCAAWNSPARQFYLVHFTVS